MKLSWGGSKDADEAEGRTGKFDGMAGDLLDEMQRRLAMLEVLPQQLEGTQQQLLEARQQIDDLQAAAQHAEYVRAALDTLSLSLRAQPTIALYASGLGHFCQMFEEEFYRQHPEMHQRFLVQRTAALAFQQFTQFVSWAHQQLAAVHESLSQGPLSEATRDLWETYVVPIHGKFEECTARLQALQPQQAGGEEEIFPDFDQYLRGLLSDAGRTQHLLDHQSEAFTWVLQEYARAAAHATMLRVQASQQSATNAIAEGEKLRAAVRSWLVADLLRLSDYLDEMGEKARSSGAAMSPQLSGCVQSLLAEFKNLLRGLHVEPIVIELNRDQMAPALHEIVQRNGPGQTIVKIVAPGFAWEGEPLRKAEVWVA